ncbi:uncharacterized protein LTR77_008898 [Saxophila tyrrhenica]|uniref:DUF2786 domain-containing protein n=1 Tax=Saxophila tyrrhenica TaxID=1690608 RepID=A0AAV9NZL7_9PEZI|nr:hypothetical protein LTR77_008898 [Saxophila tyrrhenica]
MAKRNADAVASNEQDGDQAPLPRKRAARPRASPKLPQPLYKACRQANPTVTSATSDIDTAVVAKIKKCLDKANHPGTAQAEAKAAFYLASQEMARFNISQADVLAHESASVQRQFAGQSVITLRRLDGDKSKAVQNQTWADCLAGAMEIFFDCKYDRTSKGSSFRFTFYGIAEYTVAAALSFRSSYSLIAEWARPHRGKGTRNSYCLGACEELERIAEKQKAAEELRAKEQEKQAVAMREKQEQAERQAELDRLAPAQDAPPCPDGRGSDKTLWHGDDGNSTATGLAATCVDHDDKGDYYGGDSMETAIKLEDDEDEGVDTASGRFADVSGGEDSEYSSMAATRVGDQGVDEGVDEGVDIAPGSPSDSSDEEDENGLEPDSKVEDNDDDDVGPRAFEDVDEEMRRLVKTEPLSPERSVATEPESDEVSAPTWASHLQLVTFRETASKIADDYLKDSGMKLKAGRARNGVVRDWDAYDLGVEDGKKIDVHQRRIEDGE